MIEINKNPSRKELRWFGLMFGAFFGIVGALLHFKFGVPTAARVVWATAGVLVVVYYVAPPLRRPMFIGWLYAAFPIGWVVSHVVLGAIYYLLITPVGIVRRTFGQDPMTRRFEPDAKTYWIEYDPGKDKARYFRQF